MQIENLIIIELFGTKCESQSSQHQSQQHTCEFEERHSYACSTQRPKYYTQSKWTCFFSPSIAKTAKNKLPHSSSKIFETTTTLMQNDRGEGACVSNLKCKQISDRIYTEREKHEKENNTHTAHHEPHKWTASNKRPSVEWFMHIVSTYPSRSAVWFAAGAK